MQNCEHYSCNNMKQMNNIMSYKMTKQLNQLQAEFN
jgi:hypothetical protein